MRRQQLDLILAIDSGICAKCLQVASIHVSIPSPIELVPTVQYLLGIEVIIAGFNTGFFYHSVLD
jgi:hypothetical protein